jgi:Sigma-70, region 4
MDQALLARLSPNERAILALLDLGLNHAEIGQRLLMSEHTIRTYLENIDVKREVTVQDPSGAGSQGRLSTSWRSTASGFMPCLRAVETLLRRARNAAAPARVRQQPEICCCNLTFTSADGSPGRSSARAVNGGRPRGGTRRTPPCSAAGRSHGARHREPPTTWAV